MYICVYINENFFKGNGGYNEHLFSLFQIISTCTQISDQGISNERRE